MRNRRKKLLLFGFALAAIISGFLFLTRNTEPRYEGKPLSYWVGSYFLQNPEQIEKADEAIRHIGTNAIPYLLEWIPADTSPGKFDHIINVSETWLNEKLRPNHIWEPYGLARTSVPNGVPQAFAALGAKAEMAVPALARLLVATNGDNTLAARSLGLLGRPGLSPLLEAFTNSVVTNRQPIAFALAFHGTNAEPAIPALIQALDNEDKHISSSAYWILTQLKLKPDIVIPAMIAKLQSGETNDLNRVGYVLAEYGPLARPALPLLLSELARIRSSGSTDGGSGLMIAIHKIDPQSYTNALTGSPSASPASK